MNFSVKDFANKKWFVPLIIIIMISVALSSFSPQENKEGSDTVSERLEELCIAISGSEEVQVMITYENATVESFWSNNDSSQKVCGVAVICDGGDDPDIKLRIYDVVKSLFGIPSTRISVSGSF